MHLRVGRLTLKVVRFLCENDEKLARFIGRGRGTIRPNGRCVSRFLDLSSDQLDNLLGFLIPDHFHTFAVIVECQTGRILLAIIYTATVHNDCPSLQKAERDIKEETIVYKYRSSI